MPVVVGDRFSAVNMDSDIPTAFSAQNDTDLGYQLLSHGTKDTVALAWPFALSEKFLGEETGFIILDDPMVDIDPERRKEVVKAINAFSEQHQVIVMTCHPNHAKTFNDVSIMHLS